MTKQFNYNYVDTDIIDKFIRVTKKEPEMFVEKSLALTDLDTLGGVSAIVGRMKGDEGNAIQSYLFLKDLWTQDQAANWVYETELTGEIKQRDNNEIVISKIKDILNLLANEVSDTPELSSAFSKKELKELKGVEIFAAGKWNGDTYTVDDLHEMATNFPRLKDTLQPYVKLGHDGSQKLLQKDGYPAAGWIENVYVKGDKLYADIVDMPKKIHDLIKNKAYKRVSSEIYWNMKDQAGKVYKRVLKAVALLGGDTPAVGSLADVQALYTKRYVSEIEADAVKVYEEQNKEGDDEVMEKELEKANARIEELEVELKETEKKFSEAEVELKDVRKAQSEAEYSLREKEVTVKVEELISNKKILPKQKEYMVEELLKESSVKAYSDKGDKWLDENPLVKMFEEGADVVDTEETSEESEEPKTDEVKEEKVAENIKGANSYTEAADIYINKEGDES